MTRISNLSGNQGFVNRSCCSLDRLKTEMQIRDPSVGRPDLLHIRFVTFLSLCPALASSAAVVNIFVYPISDFIFSLFIQVLGLYATLWVMTDPISDDWTPEAFLSVEIRVRCLFGPLLAPFENFLERLCHGGRRQLPIHLGIV